MSDMRFIPRDDFGKEGWLRNFAERIGDYAAAAGISPEEVAQTRTDAEAFSYIMKARRMIENHARGLTIQRDALRDGEDYNPVVFGPPPDFGPAPAGARGGIFSRAANLAQRVKTSDGYTAEAGALLRIISTKKSIGDLNTIAPEITVKLVSGHPVVGYRKGRLTGVEVWVSRGDNGNYEAISRDSHPPFHDKSPLPPPGTAQIWSYKAVYLLRDDRVGQFSNIVRVTVTGF